MSDNLTTNTTWETKPLIQAPRNRNDRKNTLGTSKIIENKPITKADNRATTLTKRQADKEFKQNEQNILTGDANVIPNVNYRAKATIKLQGLGVLTGLYYVEKVTHTFSKDNGYSQVLSLSKNGVGDSIKKGIISKPTPEPPKSVINPTRPNNPNVPVRPPVSPPKPAQRTYKVVKGDTLWGIARKYYGNGAKYTTIYNANKNIIKNPNLIYPGQVLVIP